MRDYPFVILIIFLGLYLTLFTTNYKIEEYRHSSLVLSITESAKIAGFRSLDNSIRAERGKAEITTDNFEMSFEKTFKEIVNVKLSSPEYSYDYLRAADGSLMAIRVKVKDEQNAVYQATYVTDVR